MKAFLMYHDRDFDPTLLLSRRERQLRSRTPDHGLDLKQMLPSNEAALVQDLDLQVLFNAMANGDHFLFEVAKVALLSGLQSRNVILYRQRVAKDCLQYESVVREMYQISIAAIAEEKKHYWSSNSRYPAGTLYHAVNIMQMFVVKLKALRQIADRNYDQFRSEGFSNLFSMLRSELDDNYFTTISNHLNRLKFRRGVLVSASLGRGNKGSNYLLRKSLDEDVNWIWRLINGSSGYTYRLHPRDDAGTRALSELRNHGVNLVANALAQSTDHILSFFQMLRTELAFYVGCLNLRRHLNELEEPICFPLPLPHGERKWTFVGLYDVCLALTRKQKVIGNNLDVDNKDLIVITGANSGGKSTFLRSLGLSQLMMQSGMFVAAERFSTEIRDALFTHYKREEDVSMESGKLDEELDRMNEIVSKLSPKSMVLFNESFAATNEREGSEIAMQITSALLKSGVKVLFVTHLHEFASKIHAKQTPNTIFLRAERLRDGKRSFRLTEGEPLRTSYGNDLYDAAFDREREPIPSRTVVPLPE